MSSWGYKKSNGPSTWCQQFPVAAGKRQSPIDIDTKAADYDSKLQGEGPLAPKYSPETDMEIKNTGHSVTAKIKSKSELSGGPLKNTYRLEQFHLHWGSDDLKGSEHTINGKAYASELHLVHWNADKYGSFAEAAKQPDGLAVIGIMIKGGDENAAFKPISDNVKNVSQCDDTYTIPGVFDPAALLPGNLTDYWTYEGSLTTPPLYESVQWIVLREGIELSPKQLQQLRSMKNHEGECLQDNFRPPLPLFSRKVTASFK